MIIKYIPQMTTSKVIASKWYKYPEELRKSYEFNKVCIDLFRTRGMVNQQRYIIVYRKLSGELAELLTYAYNSTFLTHMDTLKLIDILFDNIYFLIRYNDYADLQSLYLSYIQMKRSHISCRVKFKSFNLIDNICRDMNRAIASYCVSDYKTVREVCTDVIIMNLLEFLRLRNNNNIMKLNVEQTEISSTRFETLELLHF